MKKNEIINALSTIDNNFINALKKGLEEATVGGHEWPHRWPCDGGRLIPLDYIRWDEFYNDILSQNPTIQWEENKNGDIIVSLTFPNPIGDTIEHIPVPGATFFVMFWGPHPYRGEGEWSTVGHWSTRKIPTNIVSIIFRNINDTYVLGTVFPGPFKDPGDYSGFDPDRRTKISIDEIIRRKINFRIAENVTTDPLIDNFIKKFKLVDPKGVEHKLIPITQE